MTLVPIIAADSSTINVKHADGDTVEAAFAKLTQAPSLSSSLGAATKANTKNAAGAVLSVYASNGNAAARYLQLHNKASAPAATDVPMYAFLIKAGEAVQITESFFKAAGKAFGTGIGWAISTTMGTFTDSATASEHSVHLHYV